MIEMYLYILLVVFVIGQCQAESVRLPPGLLVCVVGLVKAAAPTGIKARRLPRSGRRVRNPVLVVRRHVLGATWSGRVLGQRHEFERRKYLKGRTRRRRCRRDERTRKGK